MTTPSIDLAQFSKQIGQPDPIVFQRRANVWLRALRRELGTVRIGAATLDPMDALRSVLNLKLGRALEHLSLCRALAARFGGTSVSLGRGEQATGISQVSRWFEGAPRIERPPRLERAVGRARVFGWLARRQVIHQLGAWRERSSTQRLKEAAAFIVVRSPDHLLHVVPIARELSTKHHWPILFGVADDTMRSHLERAGFPAVNLYHCASTHPARLALEVARLLGRAQKVLSGLQPEGFDAVEAQVLGAVSGHVLRENVPDLLRLARGIGWVLERSRPSLVLAANPYTLEGRVAWRLGASMKIPTAAVEHGTVFVNDPIWDECAVDTFCAWGEHSRKALLACGLNDRQIAVVGSPRLDDALSAKRPARAGPPSVLVATSGPGDQISHAQHSVFVEALYEAAAAAPEIRWVVKLHRKDLPELYASADRRHPGGQVEVVPFDAASDIFDFLVGARAMVTIASAAALEAIVADIPVITVQVSSGPASTRVEFIELGATRHVRSAKELADEARRAFEGIRDPVTDAAAKAFATRHFANLGHAAEAAAARLVAGPERS